MVCFSFSLFKWTQISVSSLGALFKGENPTQLPLTSVLKVCLALFIEKTSLAVSLLQVLN